MSLVNLDTVLRGIMPARRVEIVMSAYEVLTQIYGIQVDGKINDLLNLAKNQDVLTFNSFVNDTTVVYLTEAITTFGVTINDKYQDSEHLEVIKNVLYGLYNIDEYEDPQSLLSILLQENVSNEVKLSEVLAELTDMIPHDYMEVLEKVSPDLIMKTIALLDEKVRDNTPENIEDDEFSFTGSIGLQRFIQEKKYQVINPELIEVLGKQPGKLSLSSILRLYGNAIADDNKVETWLFALWVSHDGTIDQLFFLWEKHFLEEKDLIDMRTAVESEYNRLMAEDNNDA